MDSWGDVETGGVGVGRGVCPLARVEEGVEPGVVMQVSELESAEVDSDAGEWIWREAVLGMIVSGEVGGPGIARV